MLVYMVYLYFTVTITCSRKPNIVLIVTDDQDVTMKGLQPMVAAKKLIADLGMDFKYAYATTPICCPSRASILTGRYLHNTGVRNNTIAGGCNDQKWREELEQKTFASRLKEEGYRTMYAGKYLNQYGTREGGGVEHVPPGWDWWLGLVGNSKYYNYTLSVNGKPKHHGDSYTKDYLTDVIRRKAVRFLDTMYKKDKESPFLMVLAPPACHAPFTPAPKNMGMFSNVTAPRTASFNRFDKKDLPKHWLMQTQPRKMTEETIQKVDEMFRNRWRTLVSVDTMIDKVIQALVQYKMMDDTFIILTSDNGFHMGQFAMPLDKRLPYEFDIRIPMWIRGPGIDPGQSVTTPVLTIDLAPTLLDLAGVVQKYDDMDGLTLTPLLIKNNTVDHNNTSVNATEQLDKSYNPTLNSTVPIMYNYTGIQGRSNFLVEYHGEGSAHTSSDSCAGHLNHDLDNLSQCSDQFGCKCQDSRNNTYTCIRTIGQEDTMFCQFQDRDNFLEMYNLMQDPEQIINLASLLSSETINYYKKQISNLLKCKGKDCNSS